MAPRRAGVERRVDAADERTRRVRATKSATAHRLDTAPATRGVCVIARTNGYCAVCGDYIVARRTRPSLIRALAAPLRPQRRAHGSRPRVWVHERCWLKGETLLLWQYLEHEGLVG